MLAVSQSSANPRGSVAEPRWNQAGSQPAVTALEAQLQNIPGRSDCVLQGQLEEQM